MCFLLATQGLSFLNYLLNSSVSSLNIAPLEQGRTLTVHALSVIEFKEE